MNRRVRLQSSMVLRRKNKLEYPKEGDNGWIGILQHYFVAAWIPKEGAQREFFTRKLDNGLYSIGTVVPFQLIEPNSKGAVSVTLYAGPAIQNLIRLLQDWV